jgi:hypothetical protein
MLFIFVALDPELALSARIWIPNTVFWWQELGNYLLEAFLKMTDRMPGDFRTIVN